MSQFSLLDTLVVISYLAGVLGIGIYFLKRQKSTEDFFIASKRIPGWAMGLGLIATLISNITFLAFPGAAFASSWVLFTQNLLLLVVIYPIAFCAVPFYRNVIGSSLYEYFEKRFGYGVRAYGALTFILYYISKLGVIFFVLSLALSTMTGLDIYQLILVTGIITIFYTLMGGIEAVTWTDVVQGLLLIGGGLVCLGILLFDGPVAPGIVFEKAWEAGKFNLGEQSFNLERETLTVMILYGFAQHAHNYGTDQTMIQRYLTAKTTKEAVRGALISGIACIPVWALFFVIGTALWGYYTLGSNSLPQEIAIKPDQVFPYFIMTELPSGVKGLIVVALASAAMSTISGGLNSISTVFTTDLYSRIRIGNTQSKLRVARISLIVAGGLSLLLAMWLVTKSSQVLVIYFIVLSVFVGGILGLVLLAVLSKKANLKGVTTGIVVTVLVTSWATLTGNGVVDLGIFNFTLHPFLIGFLSHVTMFLVGHVASLFFQDNIKNTAVELTVK
jgi:SSS family solute:Na+ symporter